MHPDQSARGKALIRELAHPLTRRGLDLELLAAFLTAYPEVAQRHIAALQGNHEAAAIALSAPWPGGGNALAEYVLGDHAAVLAGIKAAGLFVERNWTRKPIEDVIGWIRDDDPAESPRDEP